MVYIRLKPIYKAINRVASFDGQFALLVACHLYVLFFL